MIQFTLSAFSDELSPDIDEQLKWLSENGVKYIEIRGVNGKNISELDEKEVKELRIKLDAYGIKPSCIGSPIGKINILDDFSGQKELCRKICEYAKILGTDKIRVFSFFMPEGEAPDSYRDEVMARMRELCDIAKQYSVILCHENEKNIYGDTPERCLDLYCEMQGDMKCVFDHANFISCDVEAYPYAFNMLSHTLSHMHIKDANEEKEMVVAGKGIGRIPETVKDVANRYEGEFILTLEPHLMEFSGLQGLESEGHTSILGNRYESPKAAFAAAKEALEKIINNI